MTTRIPIRTVYDAQNDPVGLAEFQVGDYLGIDYGGTGGNTVATARVALSVDDSNIRKLISVTGGGTYNNSTGVINIVATDLSPYAKTVDLTTANVTELSNLYYSNARVYANVVNAGFYNTVSNTAPIGATENGTTLSITHLNSGVAASTYGGSSKVPVFTVDATGHITSAANVNVAGVTNFAASGNTFTISTADGGSFSASIQLNSVRLGTDTTGAYVSNLVAGTGVTLTGLGNEGTTPTIAIGQAVSTTSDVTFRDVVVSGNLTVSGSQTIVNTNVIELADNQITLNSDHTGSPTQDAGIVVNRGSSANVSIFWDETNDRWSLNNSSATYIVHNTGRDVVLGTETSGNYVATVAAGTGISTTGASSGEGIAHSISLATSGVAAATYGGAGTQIPTLAIDTYGRVTSAANVAINTIKLSAHAATTSAELAGVISDETGSGSLVFANSPTLTTPNLGTPSAVVLTNATGTAANLTANIATYISVSDDTTTNATRYPIFANGTSGAVVENVSSTKLTFNPSTGLLTSTDYNSSSDKRLKKEIKTVDNALDKVTKLRGVTFTWKESDQKAIGLIAQEVQKVLPDVVNADETGYLGVRYTNIIGVLVEAIKEQQDQINTLKQQIEKLNG